MSKEREAAGMKNGVGMREGYCRFCGQANYIQASEACTQEQLNLWAAEKCGCPEGKEERDRKVQEEKADRNIRKLFGEYDAGGILKAAIHPVAVGAIQVMKTTTLTDTMEG